ncbi:probable chitinase 10 [Anopheles ziemanni]|uniref:probable chitinase 10 n=1 Tax=Anopheles coustani TaxID=139045 RepID=UPI00265A8F71|nr:probable chitinase 10 [Anopheles coustani]XP_058169969.1 probable chitinase 10 [Anopheles ziemanni]
MAESQRRSVLCSLIMLVTFAMSGQSCPQLRECFPDRIVPLDCKSNSGFDWVMEASTSDCSMYLNCFNGIGVQSCCPVGLYFNPDLMKCDEPENVECDIVPPPCPEDTTTSIPEGDTTTEGGTTPDTEETDTTSEDPTTTAPDETTTEAAENTTIDEGSELDALCSDAATEAYVVLPYPEDCNMYVECQNRELISVENCPAGLHFNPTKSVCDSPDHAECLDYVCQDNPEGKLLELSSVNDCRLHFLCVGNTTIVRLCAPGTVFDGENGWCIPDDAENPCQRVRPPAPPTSVIDQCRADSELKKIPHPQLCDVYYRCLNGRLFVRQCPPGLLFDNDRAQCNLAENVSCVEQENELAQ